MGRQVEISDGRKGSKIRGNYSSSFRSKRNLPWLEKDGRSRFSFDKIRGKRNGLPGQRHWPSSDVCWRKDCRQSSGEVRTKRWKWRDQQHMEKHDEDSRWRF